MKRIVLFLGILLLAIPARAQYLDGLPAVSAVASADIIPVCQGGTAGHPGTCTTRKATASQLQLGSLLNTNLNLGTGTLTAAGSSLSGTLTTGTGGTNGFLLSGSTLSVAGTGNPTTIFRGLGTGQISFQTGATPFTGFAVTDGGASAVNSLRVSPGTTGNGATLQALGDAAAILNLKAGTSGTAGSVKSFVPMNVAGSFQFGANTVYTAGTGIGGVPSTNQAQSWNNVTLSGTVTTGFGSPYFWQVADNIALASTNADLFYFADNLGAGSDGGRVAMGVGMSKTAAAATAATEYGYVTLLPFMHADHGDGGTSTTALGEYWAINPDIRCNTGDWMLICISSEQDVRLYAGTTATLKANLVLNYGIGDASHAAGVVGTPTRYQDDAIVIQASPTIGNGTGKGLVAIGLGGPTVDIPWDTTNGIGTAIMAAHVNIAHNFAAGQAMTAYIDNGFNLPEVYVRGKFIDNGAFYVSGTGAVTSGNATLAAVSTGQSLSVSGVIEVSAVVVSGGNGARVGSEIIDSIGGLWEVATITGEAVATVTLKRAASGATCPVSPTATRMFNATSQPTLTITCANRLGLTVQGASGTLGFYGATPIVKATPVGACAGNTGCQALRDALGNLGLINTGSISD